MILLLPKDLSELFMKRREFHPSSGFLILSLDYVENIKSYKYGLHYSPSSNVRVVKARLV